MTKVFLWKILISLLSEQSIELIQTQQFYLLKVTEHNEPYLIFSTGPLQDTISFQPKKSMFFEQNPHLPFIYVVLHKAIEATWLTLARQENIKKKCQLHLTLTRLQSYIWKPRKERSSFIYESSSSALVWISNN